MLGSLWDIWATRHGKKDKLWLWQFHDQNTLGLKFFDLPIEEYLFYPASSLYVIFMWEGVKFGYETGSVFYLILLSTLAIWTLLAVILSFSLTRKQL